MLALEQLLERRIGFSSIDTLESMGAFGACRTLAVTLTEIQLLTIPMRLPQQAALTLRVRHLLQATTI